MFKQLFVCICLCILSILSNLVLYVILKYVKYANIFKEPELYEDLPTEELPAIIPIKPKAPAPKGTLTIKTIYK